MGRGTGSHSSVVAAACARACASSPSCARSEMPATKPPEDHSLIGPSLPPASPYLHLLSPTRHLRKRGRVTRNTSLKVRVASLVVVEASPRSSLSLWPSSSS
eukprot:295251-Pyramimonas_sp.AAC.1